MVNEVLELEVTDTALEEESQVLDVLPRFDITAYGADYPVDALVQRFRTGDVVVPQWQRGWVWNDRDAARFIESLLLGLPVPGIFLYEDAEGALVVIDGQQRLRSLVAFYDNDLNGHPFHLPQRAVSRYQAIHPDFAGKSYAQLTTIDRRRLDNQIIHATIVRQDNPEGDLSIYHLFERINSTGARLTPQEIRAAIYRGKLDDLLQELNGDDAWRAIFGRESRRLKDQELILRFMALYERLDQYERPMSEFLNVYMRDGRHFDEEHLEALRQAFHDSIGAIHAALGNEAFRPERPLNAAVFDAVMVGVAKRLLSPDPLSSRSLRDTYERLLALEDFRDVYLRSTSDNTSVKRRVELATNAFAEAV